MSDGLPTARELAMRVLRDVERRNGFSNRILAEHLERHAAMDRRDRGLTTVLVYGVLRHRLRLDAHIDHHAKKPTGLKGNVRDALRIAAFERLELKRPAAIAITEATKLIRKFDRGGRIAGAAQAILSALDTQGEALDAKFDGSKDLIALEQRWSVPRWLGGRWIKEHGADRARARARAMSVPPPVDLRIDLGQTSRAEVVARLLEDHPGVEIDEPAASPQALRLRGGGDVFYGPLHDEGLISVQGLAAQHAAIWLAPQPGARVLDACSGMGIKTLQLAELMQRRGTLVSAELEPRQLQATPDLVARGQMETPQLELQTVEADVTAAHPQLDDEPFDSILLDVPCTGLGNLARHPEIRYARRYEDIAERAVLQERLLRACLKRLAPGGTLCYAVCSFSPEEGPDLVQRVAADVGATVGRSRTFTPEVDETEGFHVATLRLA